MNIFIFLVFFNLGSPAIYRDINSLCNAEANDSNVSAIYQLNFQEPATTNSVSFQQITCQLVPATQVTVPQTYIAKTVGAIISK